MKKNFERLKYKEMARELIFKDFAWYAMMGLAVIILTSFISSSTNIQLFGPTITTLNVFGFPILNSYMVTHSTINAISFLWSVLILAPITYGFEKVMYLKAAGKDVNHGNFFDGFKDNYPKVVAVNLFVGIIVGIGMVLFLVPGIIATYCFIFVNLTMVAKSELGIRETLSFAKETSKGYKVDLFIMSVTFLGWIILSSLTFGLVGVFVQPYMALTLSFAYIDLTTPAVDTWAAETDELSIPFAKTKEEDE